MHKHLLLILLLGLSSLTACNLTPDPDGAIPVVWNETDSVYPEEELKEVEDGEVEQNSSLRISFYHFSFVLDLF